MKKNKWFLLFWLLVVVSCKPEKVTPPTAHPSAWTKHYGCDAIKNIHGVWREDSGAIIGICWDLDKDIPSDKITVRIKKVNPKAFYALDAGVYKVGEVDLSTGNVNNMIDLFDAENFNNLLRYDSIDTNTIGIIKEGYIRWKRIKFVQGKQKVD
jgi:hypothetical protein